MENISYKNYKTINKIGWVSSILLAFCGLPEAYRAIFAQNYDISALFLLTWGLGEAGLLLVSLTHLKKKYLILNYSANLFFILIMTGRLVYDWVTF